MKAEIYIESNIKGAARRDGVVGYVIEAQTSKGPATVTQFIQVANATKNLADLIGLQNALSRIKTESELVIYIDNTHIQSAIVCGWVEWWKEDGWVTSKRKPVANKDVWADILSVLGERLPLFGDGETHKYKKWLESELERRMKKTKGTTLRAADTVRRKSRKD